MAEPELLAHREWLGYLQPVGVVVSPPALVAAQAYVNRNAAPVQQLLLDVIDDTPNGPVLSDLKSFVADVLRWEEGDLSSPPDELECVLPEYGEVLRPAYAVREPEPDEGSSHWLMLVQVVSNGADLDAPAAADDGGWQASPEARFERLLREVQVPTGLLVNGTHLRLVHAPRGETSGYFTFPVAAMTEVAGRPVLAALEMLLCAERLFSLPKEQRLPAILAASRKYQNEVSTKLAGQVLAGLYELLRGFQAADGHTGGRLLGTALRENPDHIYEGLLTVLLRLVFLFYTEDRDLMPADEVYVLHYAAGGLFDRLRDDADRHPDTMDLRYGAWAQLLSLFRVVFDGVRSGTTVVPARHGHLFDPDRFPFLEGRPYRGIRVMGDRVNDVPLVSDGVVWRVLRNLLLLEGERLSYRSLDVEQIGSVYETMMGFRLEIAYGHSLALKPAKPHGAPITINVDELLASPAAKRAQWVKEQADQKLTDREAAAVATASTVIEVEAAIERKIDRRATPSVVPPGAMVLQPNEERRRSGSFYTPRSLTEPIVRTTLRPIFEQLGANPTPEAILDLKVCDAAMGSGAFLVEACRQLADKLVDAWHAHDSVPTIPPDSDELLHARRLVAHRCLYGVDRNPIAVDLAKLSLWLATLARDHAFTFLDHALRWGDSLVGMTRRQIAAFHWSPGSEKDFITRRMLEAKLHEAERLRAEIRDAGDETTVQEKRFLLRQADEALDDLRLAGDLVVLAFFEGANARERQIKRDQLAQKVWRWQRDEDPTALIELASAMREDRRLFPFHWEIEFPEVFDREGPGFNAIIGNPPFLNAIEFADLREASVGPFYALTFPPFAAGAYDQCLLFWARSLQYLLASDGRYGLLSPTVLLSATTQWKRWMHKNWRPDGLILYPVDTFEGSRIRTVAICGAHGRAPAVEVLDLESEPNNVRRSNWSEEEVNWHLATFSVSQVPAPKGIAPWTRLGQCALVHAGCTTADAYDLKPQLLDDLHAPGLRLVTTGAIDRYRLKWGEMLIRYLKDDYAYPRWPVQPASDTLRRSAQRQSDWKLLVGGLTSVLEVWLDEEGDTGGTVQTWVIKPADPAITGKHPWWYVVLGVLNSATFSRIFVARHGAAAMSGRQITVKKSDLLEMSVPAVCQSIPDDWRHLQEQLPPISEWSDESLQPAVARALGAAVRQLLRLPPASLEFRSADKVAHYLAGALYGRDEAESKDDYDWWCDRAGVETCLMGVPALIEQGKWR